MIKCTLACNLDRNILLASLPLFEAEQVDAIEWSFDALYKVRNIPDWFVELIKSFSDANRLIGHGVFFSLFSGRWTADQQAWLDRLEQKSKDFNFDHITEHFGFMTGANFHEGAPISIPFNATTLSIGQDRLKRIHAACERPVGLENLAIAYDIDEVKRHGEFLEQLVEPINGFIILDLHNLYCQLHNFNISFEKIIDFYPLDRVREIHISGGSWEDSILSEKKIRRDTHDDSVPEAVFVLLKKAIPLCPNLQYVTMEQMGSALDTEENKINFQKDFLEMRKIVALFNKESKPSVLNEFLPKQTITLDAPIQSELLHQQQRELANILETSGTYVEAQKALQKTSLAKSDWKVENWNPEMLQTVILIAQKWKV